MLFNSSQELESSADQTSNYLVLSPLAHGASFQFFMLMFRLRCRLPGIDGQNFNWAIYKQASKSLFWYLNKQSDFEQCEDCTLVGDGLEFPSCKGRSWTCLPYHGRASTLTNLWKLATHLLSYLGSEGKLQVLLHFVQNLIWEAFSETFYPKLLLG